MRFFKNLFQPHQNGKNCSKKRNQGNQQIQDKENIQINISDASLLRNFGTLQSIDQNQQENFENRRNKAFELRRSASHKKIEEIKKLSREREFEQNYFPCPRPNPRKKRSKSKTSTQTLNFAISIDTGKKKLFKPKNIENPKIPQIKLETRQIQESRHFETTLDSLKERDDSLDSQMDFGEQA